MEEHRGRPSQLAHLGVPGVGSQVLNKLIGDYLESNPLLFFPGLPLFFVIIWFALSTNIEKEW